MYTSYFISRTENPTGKVMFAATYEEKVLLRDVLPQILDSMLKKYGQATPSVPPT
jgi:hypothetical protein